MKHNAERVDSCYKLYSTSFHEFILFLLNFAVESKNLLFL